MTNGKLFGIYKSGVIFFSVVITINIYIHENFFYNCCILIYFYIAISIIYSYKYKLMFESNHWAIHIRNVR